MKRLSARLSVAFLTIVLCVVALSPSSRLKAALADSDNGKDRIVGTWEITITGSPFKILRTYTAEGTIVDAYAFPPFTFTPGPLINTAGHGVWRRTGPSTYKAEVKYFQLDPGQNASFQVLNSTGVVRELVTIDRSTGAYSSTFSTQVYDATGTLIITNGGATTGTEMKIDF